MLAFTYIKIVIDITPFFVRADYLIEPVVNIWRITNILPYFIEYIPIKKIYVFVSMGIFIGFQVTDAFFLSQNLAISFIAVGLCSMNLLYGSIFFIVLSHGQNLLHYKNTNFKKEEALNNHQYTLNKIVTKKSNNTLSRKKTLETTTQDGKSTGIDTDLSFNNIVGSIESARSLVKVRERVTVS